MQTNHHTMRQMHGRIRLPRQRQLMGPIDHRFALNRPDLVSASDKTALSRVSLPCRPARYPPIL
jgi:hypothetical protein